MKKYFFYVFLLLSLLSCHHDKDSDDSNTTPSSSGTTYSYTCIVVNQGNYSESNGSISLYNSATGAVTQEVFTTANGYKLGSIIESATLHGDLILLMCNNEDKVVLLNSSTMKAVSDPITGIGIPRYAAIHGNYAYVSCWQKKNSSGTVTVAQHVAKIDLSTKKVVGSLQTTGQPEGMLVKADTLYVASGSGMDVYNANTDVLIKHIDSQFTTADAQQLVADKNGYVWLSLGTYSTSSAGGFMCVNPSTLTIKTQVAESKLTYEGDMAVSPAKDKIYFLYSNGIVSGQTADVTTSVYSLDVSSYQVSSSPVVTGVGFYGLGVEPSTGTIYTANVNGFITNSMMYLYNTSGNKLASLMTGVGTCRFVFK
jgi:hypothetical protein